MFRFTIRDVLWLTVVVALACGWSIHAVRSAAMRRELARLRSNYESVKGAAHEMHGWLVHDQGENGITIIWPNSPPPQPGQVVRQSGNSN